MIPINPWSQTLTLSDDEKYLLVGLFDGTVSIYKKETVFTKIQDLT